MSKRPFLIYGHADWGKFTCEICGRTDSRNSKRQKFHAGRCATIGLAADNQHLTGDARRAYIERRLERWRIEQALGA